MKKAQSQEAEQQEPLLVANELRKLKDLLDEGVLTQEESDEQKRKLLESSHQ